MNTMNWDFPTSRLAQTLGVLGDEELLERKVHSGFFNNPEIASRGRGDDGWRSISFRRRAQALLMVYVHFNLVIGYHTYRNIIRIEVKLQQTNQSVESFSMSQPLSPAYKSFF